MRVLGIDPALNKTGWGIIDVASDKSLKFVASGIIKVNMSDDLFTKLKFISKEIIKIIDDYNPDEISIEEVFVNKNPLTSLKLGHARGVIMISCLKKGDHIYEYGANKIKKAICGAGKADKYQISMMVKQILPKAEFCYDDESDALAAAICHIHYRNSFSLIQAV